MSNMTTADILARCDRRERDLKHKKEAEMPEYLSALPYDESDHTREAKQLARQKVKVTYWTGETKEYEGLTVEQVLAKEYPEFANGNQESENGWVATDTGDPNPDNLAVYNKYGDWCCTVETTKKE
jgi:hypothetical protein